jgi:hypothetical protein
MRGRFRCLKRHRNGCHKRLEIGHVQCNAYFVEEWRIFLDLSFRTAEVRRVVKGSLLLALAVCRLLRFRL